MNFPRHTNPHFIAQATQPVSRADIFSGNGGHAVETVYDKNPRAQLDNVLLKRVLDLKRSREIRNDEGRRPKRKRVKGAESGENVDDPEVVECRLISTSLPPRMLSLAPKPHLRIRVKEPEYEDTDEQSAQRATQAQSVAVDFEWIMEEAAKPIYPHPIGRREVVKLDTKLPSPVPPIMITERPKPPLGAAVRKERSAYPSPHALPTTGFCCPIVPIRNECSALTKKRKRCPKPRRTALPHHRLQPGYPIGKPVSQCSLKSGDHKRHNA